MTPNFDSLKLVFELESWSLHWPDPPASTYPGTGNTMVPGLESSVKRKPNPAEVISGHLVFMASMQTPLNLLISCFFRVLEREGDLTV